MKISSILTFWCISLLGVNTAQATVLSLNGAFEATRITGTGLSGLISEGDEVFAEAFYDTDMATLRLESPNLTAYDFPEEGAGVRFAVNGLVWETTGPLTVVMNPTGVRQLHPDGTVAASYGGPRWLAYTSLQSFLQPRPTTIQTPFGAESGQGRFIIFGPTFPSELFPDTQLPTALSLDQLAGPFFGHGSAAGEGPNGPYSFDLTSPIPEPETYAMMLTGLGLLGLVRRKKQSTLQKR